MQIQYSIFTYLVIQSRGEQQGVEQRAGGRSSEQGRALTLGAWGGCREEQRREADGSPAGRRMGPCREADGKPTGPLQEADARRVPCREAELQSRRRTGALQAAGRTRSSGRQDARWLATPEAEARRESRNPGGRSADARLIAPPRLSWARLLIPAPATPFPRHSFLPPAHAPTFFSTFTP